MAASVIRVFSTVAAYARYRKGDNVDVAIGLNYVPQPDENSGQWQWVDGSAATFTNWRKGEPGHNPRLTGTVMSLLDWDRGQWRAIDAHLEATTALCERRPDY